MRRLLLVVLALVLAACTCEPMPRLLDQLNAQQLGKTVTFDPDLVQANENGRLQIVRTFPVLVVEPDAAILQKEERAGRLVQPGPEIITLAIEAIQLDVTAGPGTSREVLIQGILEFGAGSGLQGAQAQTTVVVGVTTTLDSRVIFDIGTGTQLSFPTRFVKLTLLYTSTQPAGFITGARVGPRFQVAFTLGHSDKPALGDVTKTDPSIELLAANSTTIARPKYAKQISFHWTPWTGAGTTPLSVTFNSTNGGVWDVTYVNAQVPPARLDWPADANTVVIQNLGAATMSSLRATHYLTL